jgi:hypothetical protein
MSLDFTEQQFIDWLDSLPEEQRADILKTAPEDIQAHYKNPEPKIVEPVTDWWKAGYVKPEPVPGKPIVPHRAPQKVAPRKPLRRSHLIWWILLAWVLFIALCTIPGILYQIR